MRSPSTHHHSSGRGVVSHQLLYGTIPYHTFLQTMLKGGGGNFAAELPEAQQKGVKAGMVWYLGTGMDIKNHLFSQLVV